MNYPLGHTVNRKRQITLLKKPLPEHQTLAAALQYGNFTRQFMVPIATISVQITIPPLKESCAMLRLAAGLVFVENNRSVSITRRSVKPRIALGLRRFPRFAQHLERGLIGMKHLAH